MPRFPLLVLSMLVSLAATRPAAADPPPPPPPATTSHPVDGQTIAVLVGAGVAVVGFAIGTGYGIDAISKKSAAESVCPGSTVCPTPAGIAKWNSAESAATDSTFAFIVGCIGALEAAVFWLTPGAPGASSTQVGIGPGTIQLKGAW
jgi:hypothetical protein